MKHTDVIYLWSACASCTCGRLPAPHPVEVRRLGMNPDDVTSCGECGERVMNLMTDAEIDDLVAMIDGPDEGCVACGNPLELTESGVDGGLCAECAIANPADVPAPVSPEGVVVLPFPARASRI